MDTLEFAASRGAKLSKADDRMRPIVAAALEKYGTGTWYDGIVRAASELWLDIFETESPAGVPDTSLEAFQKAFIEALEKTSAPSTPPDAGQISRLTKWVGTYAVNDATFQATRSNGNAEKMWVTRQDPDVRPAHAAAHGQTVRVGSKFRIDGHELRYPGEPVGPPEVWIECRCLMRSVGKAVTAAADESFEEQTGVVIVALPAADDPIVAASSEDVPHITMVWLGDAADLTVDIEDIKSELSSWAAQIDGPLVEAVSGTATFGAESADVILVDVKSLAQIRQGMVEGGEENAANERYEGSFIGPASRATEQFPTWIPHVTLGYPETPALADYAGTEITFDRLALWVGDDRTEYPMGAAVTAAAAPIIEDDEDVITEDDLDDDVPEDDVNIELEIPFHGIAVPVGQQTGDRRQLGLADGTGASWRDLPLPFTDKHDGPEIGTITDLWIDDENMLRYKGFFRSVMDEPLVANAISRIVDGSVRGVSVDVDDVTMQVPDEEPVFEDERAALDAIINPAASVVESFRVAAIAMVAIPAYPEAYIALGEEDCTECAEEETDVPDEEVPDGIAASGGSTEADDFELNLPGFGPYRIDEDGRARPPRGLSAERDAEFQAALDQFAPGTKDGPGWVTNPVATSRIRRYWVSGKGAAKIRWGVPGDFNRCRRQLAKYVQNPDWLAGLCANMHKEAIGVWPGQEGGGRHAAVTASAEQGETAPPFYLVASADDYKAPPSDWFEPMQFDRIMPTQITKDGHIFGHLAQWGVCHIGITGVCTTPPVSPTDYAYFHTGMLETSDGTDVAVGHFAYGIGHAGIKASAAAATAHYDRDDSAFCDVVVWEDEHGIAFSGAVRTHSVDPVKVRDIRASGSFSGDWRGIGGQLELVAAVAVGTPGFPVPALSLAASGAHQTALVASGVVEHEDITPDALEAAARGGAERAIRAMRVKLSVGEKIRPLRIERAKGRVRGL